MKHILTCVAAAILAGAHSASADVIFDNYPKEVGLSFTIGPTPGPAQQAIAERFTPAANYIFNSAKVGLVNFTTQNGYTISIYNDSGVGGTPGQLLDAISNIQGVPSSPGTGDVIYNSVLHPILTAGDNYYLAIVSGSSNIRGGWTEVSSIATLSTSTNNGTTWGAPTPSAGVSLEVDGTLLLPEPTGMAYLLLCGLCLRRRRSSSRLAQ